MSVAKNNINCVERFQKYLEKLSSESLSKPTLVKHLVVGEPPVTKVILNTMKANFIISAHTGAGKTTLGRLLCAKALRGEASGYQVTYVNLRELKNLLAGGLDQARLIETLFNAQSEMGVKARKENVICSSISSNYICNDIKKCLERLYESDTRLIVYLDEIERAFEWGELSKIIVPWFINTREFYDKTNSIPLKIVVALPKVLQKLSTLEEQIRTVGGDQTWVFTEIRELHVDTQVLFDYSRKLNDALGGILNKVIHSNEYKKLLEVLGQLISGRFSVPLLQKAISTYLCGALNNNYDPNLSPEENLRKHGSIEVKPTDIETVIESPVLIGIIEGKPYKESSNVGKREIINKWKASISKLCKDLGSISPPITQGYQNFICRVNVTGGIDVLWFTLAKKLDYKTIKTVISKIMEEISVGSTKRFNILLLIPDFAKGLVAEETIPEGAKSKEKTYIKLNSRILRKDELVTIAYNGFENLPLDSNIISSIYEELLTDLKSPKTWGA